MITSFIIIVFHYIADFLFQDESWAVNKSKNIESLLKHVATYSSLWFCFSFILFFIFEDVGLTKSIIGSALFSNITFILHFVTDYFTSKQTSKMFSTGKLGSKIPNWGAFSMIGLDQVFHYLQLFSTYELIHLLI